MAVDLRYPTPLPSTKNWGPGWPNCDASNIVPHAIFQGGVHRRIFDLVQLLVAEITRRGYRFHDGWSWGYGCRATKGGSGDTPSFHSWGLALDFNAPENVFGGAASSSDINVNNHWIVPLMATYGFFWLGPSIGDWMHFSFAGSPADADAMTAKAQGDFGMTPEEAALLKKLGNFLDELMKGLPAVTAVGAAAQIAKAVNAAPTPTTTGAITVSQGDQRYALHAHGHTGSVSVT